MRAGDRGGARVGKPRWDTKAETMVQLDGVANTFRRKTMAVVAGALNFIITPVCQTRGKLIIPSETSYRRF